VVLLLGSCRTTTTRESGLEQIADTLDGLAHPVLAGWKRGWRRAPGDVPPPPARGRSAAFGARSTDRPGHGVRSGEA